MAERKVGLNPDRTDLILKVTRRFTSTLELDKVLGQVLSLTVDAIGAERGSVFVLDHAGRVTHKILARWYLPPHQSEEVISVVLSQGAAGYVFRHQEPVLVADASVDDRWIRLPDDPYLTCSALSVPLLYGGRLNGILTMTHSQPDYFDEEDLDLVDGIAGQAAVAVENARLFDRVRQERATLHAVISGVAEGVLITDTQGCILYANPAGAEALGVSAIVARGQFLRDVAPDRRLPELLQALLQSGEAQRDEIYGGEGRIFDASLVLVPSAGVVTTLHDVTHFKEVDALKSEFVSTVAHDLKSPLGLLYGYAWMLAESSSLDTEARHYTDMIIDGVEKMQQIITSLLDLIMIEDGVGQVWEAVDLPALVSESLAAFQVQIQEKELAVAVHADSSVPQIQGHPVRLGQAINNLISNAIKYTKPGGQIEVSVETQRNEVLVSVSDTGPGIPREKQAGLFTKFYKVGGQETSSQEGHGLGLAIVKSVAQAHGGRVEVESAAGQGATFTIVLPLASPAASSDDA